MPRHVVLIGLPGSGKSTVGKAVAEGLGAPLIDIDTLLVREMGMPVAQIFGMVGEAKFRQMERDAVRTARAREPCVIVPGGGWAAQQGEVHHAKQDSLVVYLSFPPQRSSAAVRVRSARWWPGRTRSSVCEGSWRLGNRSTVWLIMRSQPRPRAPR
jgi:shikimate kinase